MNLPVVRVTVNRFIPFFDPFFGRGQRVFADGLRAPGQGGLTGGAEGGMLLAATAKTLTNQVPEISAAVLGWVSNIQKYSLQDGPGIRTTVFLKGCPLRCAWCHNPENLSRRPEVLVTETRCVRCGHCAEVCPQPQAGGGDPSVQPTPGRPVGPDCQVCGACVEACVSGARQVLGQARTVKQVLREVLRDRIFYEDSDGGVTFSGGEPLSQFEFLRAALAACRERGLHTAVDTCGFAPLEHLLAIAPFTELFLYDLKFMDETLHQEFCGVSNQPILENLRVLGTVHPRIWLRIPVVPGVNDGAGEVGRMVEFARGIPGLGQVNLLPYHRTALPKFQRLGLEYRLAEVTSPTPAQMEAVAKRFAAAGLVVKVGG